MSRFVWATVTQASPLRIRLDGRTIAADITPDSLVTALVVGDRVRVEIDGRALIIHGRSGG